MEKSAKINPPIGGYFKSKDKIYKALTCKTPENCQGCCFYTRYKEHSECDSPDNLNCVGKIYEDVTDTIDVQLIDDDHKYGCFPVLSILGAGATAIYYGIYQLIINYII